MTAARPERHLDPDTVGSPAAALPGLGSATHHHRTVAVLIDPAAAASARGQMLAWVTVNLLARLYGVVENIRVACPDAALVAPVPALDEHGRRARTLADALGTLAQALADDSRACPHTVLLEQSAAAADGADVTLAIGAAVPSVTSDPTWLMCASSWKFAVVNGALAHQLDAGALPTLDEPGNVMVAAWMAAAIGVGEVFKAVNEMRPGVGRHIDLLTGNLWAGVIDDTLAPLSGPDGPHGHLTLPAHYLAGVGAVGQGYLAVLSSSHVRTDVGALDDDVLDERNLNRHVVAGVADVGAGKAHLAQMRLGNSTTRILALPYRWEDWVSMHPDDKPPLAPALQQPSESGRYALVISAVDKNPARRALAAAHPTLIFSGSSNGLAVEVGRYARDSPWQCLSCASPVAAARTLKQAAASLAAADSAGIDAAAADAGVDADRLRQYLTDPRCGTLGAAEMEKFAAFTRPDWSVSFVSVAAGTLLAARVLAHAHVQSPDSELLSRDWGRSGDTVRLWLLHGTLATTAHRRRSQCPICHGQPEPGSPDRARATW